MQTLPIVIISGAPGSGKSSIARRLAEQSIYERSVHLHTDDFYQAIRKGYIFPWLPEAQTQNITVIEAFTASAMRYAQSGYEVIIDGVIGPWFLDPWLQMTRDGWDIRFIVLRPGEQETIARATQRQAGALTNPQIISTMWKQFANLGSYEAHAIDTTNLSLEESLSVIRESLLTGAWQLS